MNALAMVNELLSRFGLKEVGTFGGTGTDSNIALRKLNLAIQQICTSHPFSWLEKTTPGTITAVQGTSSYTLASDVAYLLTAKHTYNGGGWIDVVSRETLEMYRPKRSDTGQQNIPQFMTTGGKTLSGSDWIWNVEIWPPPDALFAGQVVSYYYTYIPSDLSATSDVSIIPPDFHWLPIDFAEILYRVGPIRVGGEQNQVDLFSIASNRAKQGLAKLISRESSIGAKTITWETGSPVI